MSNNFNLKHYLELLGKQDLTETDEFQLLSYGAVVERQISYNRKDEYFSLIRQYLAKKINPSTFRRKFLEMQKADDDTNQIIKEDFEQLSNLSIDLELEEGPFSLLIDLIYNNSMLAVEFGPEDGISEDEFRVSIEKAFSNSKLFK
jgi:hypothetical protein